MENKVKYAIYSTKVGYMKIGYIDCKVYMLKKVDKMEENLEYSNFSDQVSTQLNEYFEGKRQAFDFEIELSGSHFQVKVWQELMKIPYGEVISYRELAIRTGNQNASRAVGNANNKNKISIVVPCHRVIGSNGKLVGYASGLEMKQFLIELERKNSGNL